MQGGRLCTLLRLLHQGRLSRTTGKPSCSDAATIHGGTGGSAQPRVPSGTYTLYPSTAPNGTSSVWVPSVLGHARHDISFEVAIACVPGLGIRRSLCRPRPDYVRPI